MEMNASTLKSMSMEINGRTVYPELEKCLAQYTDDLEAMMKGVLQMSKGFPLDLEPAPIFTPERN